MQGGGRRPVHTARPERGSPDINYYHFYGNVGNMTSGTNYGAQNQNATELGRSLLRIIRDIIIILSSGSVGDGNAGEPGNIRGRTGGSGFEIVSIDDQPEPPPRFRGPTLYEIYVCTLLAEGHGLPCWHPWPSQPDLQPNGVIPGDVGTYSQERGFQRIFNLWGEKDMRRLREIAQTIRPGSVYQELKGKSVTSTNALHEGEILVRGASVHKRQLHPPPLGFMYEFRRASTTQPGALLALTSSAIKEETNDPVAMGKYIKQNAEAIYKHSSSFRTLGEQESLYIITGSIKSDSWAMAAYGTHVGPEGSTLQLVPVSGVGDGEVPKYEWISHGSDERARVGRSNGKLVKDQSLFLQGFKVAFSPEFRVRVDAHIPHNDVLGAPGPDDSGTDDRHDQPGPHGGVPRFDGREGKYNGGGGRWTAPARQPSSRNHALPVNPQSGLSQSSSTSSTCTTSSSPCSLTSHDSGISLSEHASVDSTSLHPSDVINAHLLKQTGCEIAICHDDAWRFLLKSCYALIVEEHMTLADVSARIGDSGNRDISVENGVAFLLPENHRSQRKEMPRKNPNPLPNNAESASKAVMPHPTRLTVVADFPAAIIVEKRRSFESPQSTLTPKAPWSCSTPTLSCKSDSISVFRQTDVVILVLGTTGSGRSTFINALVPGGIPRLKTGDSGSLEACTTVVDHRILDEATLRAVLGFPKDYRVVLVDTPGFNSGVKSDSNMLRDIANWSQKWIPPGGCRGGVILLQDITTPANERLDKEDIAALRSSFQMVIATSKWKYETLDKAQTLHNSLASKWEKPSKKARFYSFRDSRDAPGILGGLLSNVETTGGRVDFGSVFKAMTDLHKSKEAAFTKREQGWKAMVRRIAFWKK